MASIEAKATEFVRQRSNQLFNPRSQRNAFAAMREQFEKIDTDRSGYLTKDELARMLVTSGMDEKDAKDNAEGFFKSADTNRNGKVSFDEFAAEWKRMQLFKTLRHVRDGDFKRADTNNDGKLTKNELLGLLTEQMGEESARECLDRIFTEMDADRSGAITLKEMALYYFRQAEAAKLKRRKRGRGLNSIPIAVLTDSYKASHFLMYPEADLMVAYGEFRTPFEKDTKDHRFIFYGIRYIIENFVAIRWTEADVEKAELFYRGHNAGNTPYPFPKELFLKFVRENNGYFPVRIEALPEGTCANIHVPVYQIWAEREYSRLVTFLETILTQVWYGSNVATLSRRSKDIIEEAFKDSVDPELQWLLESRLHDFGFRGASCVEASVIGGCAHLLNFTGSDTMSAGYYAQFSLNNGRPVAQSIPATEHSVMTSWRNEKLAIRNMINVFGGENRVFACVMDSYNYTNALTKVLPSVAQEHKRKGGLMVLRPDSGDPVDCILEALRAGEAALGADTNKKGFKVLRGLSAIQGDGIGYATIQKILEATLKAGYSAQNVAFGMGGGLLQKHNRDTMGFATKLCYVRYGDGKERNVMKRPKTDADKISLPGILQVRRNGEGVLMAFPRAADEKVDAKVNELKVVYDNGPVPNAFDDFDTVKRRIADQWHRVPKRFDVVSAPLKEKIRQWIVEFDQTYEKMLADD